MRKVYDCFTFFNELDLLELRLTECYNHTDYFVIAESNKSFTGNSKPFNLEENWDRFKAFHDKIIYVKVDPLICDLRIKGRNRLGENSIPINYLSNCHNYHEDMMKIMKDNSKIMIVDGQQQIMNWLNNINSFIEV